ncbi:hypothetical protein C8F04DRAFT_187539 [Mycena alexandri]|uniref:Uncharacterized protein n=1 Tax=Mycena alexandri TaxID=1745969 RepID=A0AAD6TBR3_9AGAR|nr:hypothetical protein C8F04DRAFT_187539 [Mycena alexandri]
MTGAIDENIRLRILAPNNRPQNVAISFTPRRISQRQRARQRTRIQRVGKPPTYKLYNLNYDYDELESEDIKNTVFVILLLAYHLAILASLVEVEPDCSGLGLHNSNRGRKLAKPPRGAPQRHFCLGGCECEPGLTHLGALALDASLIRTGVFSSVYLT